MEISMIFGKESTLEDLVNLNVILGLEFVIEDGGVTDVLVR